MSRSCRALLLALIACVALLASPGRAGADAYLPPEGKLFHGIGGGRAADFDAFSAQVGRHQPVFQFFGVWNGSLEWMLGDADRTRTRLMIHLSTYSGPGTRAVVTPGAIARGDGDAFLLRAGDRLARSGRIVYLRLMSEMNGHWNPYSAFDADGSRRGREHSTRAFRQAWRRTVIVLRGGEVTRIDARLRQLRLPPVRTEARTLPTPRVAFLWVPQTAGSPDIRANSPRAYWPGRAYVDWVGTDFYSRFPNFAGLDRFYRDRTYGSKPFVFAEWAMWGADDPGFVRRLFAWARRHPRTRMLMYNQGYRSAGPFQVWRYPRSRAQLVRELSSPRFPAFAPEFE